MAMRPQEGRLTRTGGRQRRGIGPGSVRSQCAAYMEPTTNQWIPPELLHALNACRGQGGESGGGSPTHQRAPMTRSQGPGGPLDTAECVPCLRSGAGIGGGFPHPEAHVTSARAGRRRGAPKQAARNHCAQHESGGGGVPPNGSVRTSRTACSRGRGGNLQPGGR